MSESTTLSTTIGAPLPILFNAMLVLLRRSFLAFLIVLLSGGVSVHGQFTENFNDGELLLDPTWSGTFALFTIVDQGGNNLLRSNSPGAANYYLSTPSTLASDARWEWFMDLQFATSGVNYVDVYLMSDNADLTAVQNGWFVRIGGTSDLVELYKRVGGTNSVVMASPPGIVNSSSSNPFKIRVERTTANLWTLMYDDGNTGSFISAGTATDPTMASSAFFGIYVVQSSAASAVNKHFFDDFVVGNIPVDLAPPVLQSATIVGPTEVDLLFNEALSGPTVSPLVNYTLDNGLSIVSAILNGPSTIRITLSGALQNNVTYTVTVNNVEDLAGNACVDQQATFLFFVADPAEFRNVVINEFMADPSPVVGLPEVEFVELFNATTDRTFDLAGWKFTDGTSTATLPNYALAPGQYVLITSTTSSTLFSSVPNRISVSSLPSLNNDGDALALTAPDNSVIDAVTYASSWYQDAVKAAGGWSLEQVNPYAACSGAGNWIASVAPIGGTPGSLNSVFDPTPDATPPALSSIQVTNASELVLVFNEAMDVASLSAASYTITPGLSVSSAVAIAGSTNRVALSLSAPMVIGTVYTLTVSGATDCTGNPIGQANTGTFALPEPVVVGDLVINEVMYDPVGSGSDFVEIYNRSQKTLTLAGLQLANETNGAIANLKLITAESILLLPGEYVLLTANTNDIATRYPQSHLDRFVQMTMPSYNNGNGTVVLLNAAGGTLDLFRYDDDLHFTLINKTEGYSLERVDPDRPTSDITNWQSAADVAGRATPGYRNSQYARAPTPTGELTIDPAIFSPDNDGHQDLLTIAYRFDQPGFVGNMIVYDLAGRESRKLMENELLGTSGSISWDGILDSGSKGRMGPYIIVLEAFDLAGNVERFRKTVTLAHRLD